MEGNLAVFVSARILFPFANLAGGLIGRKKVRTFSICDIFVIVVLSSLLCNNFIFLTEAVKQTNKQTNKQTAKVKRRFISGNYFILTL